MMKPIQRILLGSLVINPFLYLAFLLLAASVSGGAAIITATSTADATKAASCTVTVAEPDRVRAVGYADAKAVTSGPIRIIMAGDSLMRTYAANAADQAGWGQVLSQFLTS